MGREEQEPSRLHTPGRYVIQLTVSRPARTAAPDEPRVRSGASEYKCIYLR